MKKAIALILALMMAICCTAALAEETEERTPDGQYIFHNASDLKRALPKASLFSITLPIWSSPRSP